MPYPHDELRAKRLKKLWLISFAVITIASGIYENFFSANESVSSFPSAGSALASLIPLAYMYSLTAALRKAAKSAELTKLYRFSVIMSVFYLFAFVFVILYIAITLLCH